MTLDGSNNSSTYICVSTNTHENKLHLSWRLRTKLYGGDVMIGEEVVYVAVLLGLSDTRLLAAIARRAG